LRASGSEAELNRTDTSVVAGPLPVERFTAWADRHLPELGDAPLRQQVMASGAPNLLVRLDRGGTPLILRRQRAAPDRKGSRRIAREARLLAALDPTRVPTPALHAYCGDSRVIGAPFLVMSAVEGFPGYAFETYPPPYDRPGSARRALAFAAIDAVAELARLEPAAVGLSGLDRTDHGLKRQLRRWRALLKSAREAPDREPRDLPGVDYVMDWLRDNLPRDAQPGVLHGDLSFGNLLFQPFNPAWDEPARLAAMVDWEMGGLGDPRLDLGHMLFSFRGRDERSPPVGFFDPTDFPTREDLAERWAQKSGRAFEPLTYFLVLNQLQLAVRIERWRRPEDRDEPFAPALVAKAEALARGCA
jgi:aminoglycoside phosphotransferase (APT) family kinase protein